MAIISFQLTPLYATTLGSLTWYPSVNNYKLGTELVADLADIVCAEKTSEFEDKINEEEVLLNLWLIDHPDVAEEVVLLGEELEEDDPNSPHVHLIRLFLIIL
jgi:hypothetical protein